MGNFCDLPVSQQAQTGSAVAADQSESASEEDSGGEDLPEPPKFNRGPRTSVSAEAYGAWNQAKAFEAPVFQKTPDQRARLETSCNRGFMFRALEPPELAKVIDAMQEKTISQAGVTVIKQGDEVQEADAGLYVLEEGSLAVHKAKQGDQGMGPKVWQYTSQGDSFGELALLYNCPRAATVITDGPCKLWYLQRNAFNGLVKDACMRKREEYGEFIKNVPILKTLEQSEIGKLADVLRARQMKKGDVLVTEGEAGDTFFLLVAGACAATVQGKEVKAYNQKGDFFGELALKTGSDGIRKATVTCTADGSCVTVDRASFRRLLGPLETILGQRQGDYDAARKAAGVQ